MLKSIRNGTLLARCWPANTAPIEGMELPRRASRRTGSGAPAVRLDRDIDDRRPGMFAELRQRTIDVDGGCGSAVGGGLLEGWQHHRSAGRLQRLDECLIRRSIRWRGEIDVEHDVLDAGAFQPPQQIGVETARPGPDADLLDRRGVDGDNDDLAAGLTRLPGEPQIGQRIAKRAMPAGRQHDRQRNHHDDMRPVVFHVVPPAHLSPRSAPPSSI